MILAINTDVTERFFGWRFFKGDFYLGYSIVLDVLGLALIAGVAADDGPPRHHPAAQARLRHGPTARREDPAVRPPRLPRRRLDVHRAAAGDRRVTGYLLEGVRIAMDAPGYDSFSPVGWVAAQGYDGLGLSDGRADDDPALDLVVPRAARDRVRRRDPVHQGAAHAHELLEPGAEGPAGGQAAARDPARARRASPPGYGTLADFSAVHLLQLDACTKCGKCHEACPANAVGRPLSPRDVILELREQANATMSEVGVGGVLGHAARRPRQRERLARRRRSSARTAFASTRSGRACSATPAWRRVPVGIEQAPIINQIRRHLVEEGELDANLQSTLQVIHKSGNSFGENKRKRGRWTRELRLRDQGRPQRARRRAVVRRRLRLLRPALAARHAGARAALPSTRASTSGSSTTASATPATTCAGSARKGSSSRSRRRTSRRSPSASSSAS